MYQKILAFSLFLLFFIISCQQKTESPKNILARAGDRQITVEEFRQFYQLDPNFGMDSTGFPALQDELQKYIDRILAYRYAKKEGLTEEEFFKKAVNWEKQRAMLRQLYREEVSQGVNISESELRQAYLKNNIQVHVRHLFTEDSTIAWQWYSQLQMGATMQDLAKDAYSDTVLSKNGGDLGWISLGKLDVEFAEAAARLSKNEISKPVRTRWGYHVIQLLDRKDEVMLNEAKFTKQKSSLEKQIRRRKSRKLANQYISEFMSELNPQPVRSTFIKLWQAVTGRDGESGLDSPIIFSNDRIQYVLNMLENSLNEPLIRHKNGTISLGEYLKSLEDIPISNRPRFQTPRQLSDKIGIWVRDRFLLKEAKRKDLHEHSRVKEEVNEFKEEQSYLYYINQEMQDLQVPEKIERYFSEKDNSVLEAYPSLKRFHTLQEWQWWRAEQKVHQKLQNLAVEIEVNIQKLRDENQQIDWKNRIRMFAIRKPE